MSKQKPVPYIPASPRFQIASRLGAFRDTATLADPFGTGATFTIHRSGSNAHRAWFRSELDNDPMTLLAVEKNLINDGVILTPEETELIESERVRASAAAANATETPNPLLPVIDRLAFTATEQDLRRRAVEGLLRSGQMRPSDVAFRGEDEMLEEALFTLRSWDNMPDADGGMVPFSSEAARALLTNDTPLEGAGVDELVLAVDAWTIETETEIKEGDPLPPGFTEQPNNPFPTGKRIYKQRLIVPGLTLGRAYQLLFLRRANDRSLFRDQVLDAAAKNSAPSSDTTNLSGDGSNDAVQAS